MATQTNQFMTKMELASKQWQLGAYYCLMVGIDKGVSETSEIVSRSWDGKSWKGSDKEFGVLLANFQMLIIAAGLIQAPDFIKEAHHVYTEGLEKYLEFVVYAKKGRPDDADQRFRESKKLIDKAISLQNSVDRRLDGK